MKSPRVTSDVEAGSFDRMVSRRRFEEWIADSPYEREIDRFPNDAMRYAWPGQYKDIGVQFAWEAWCEAANVMLNHGAILDIIDKLIPEDLAIAARTTPFDQLRTKLEAWMTEEEIEVYGKLLEAGKYF